MENLLGWLPAPHTIVTRDGENILYHFVSGQVFGPIAAASRPFAQDAQQWLVVECGAGRKHAHAVCVPEARKGITLDLA